jgi:hypothetical protein
MMNYTKHLLSSSGSFEKERGTHQSWWGKKLMKVGQVFGKYCGSCLLSPLNMVHVCILSYNWIIWLSRTCLHLVLQLDNMLVSESY